MKLTAAREQNQSPATEIGQKEEAEEMFETGQQKDGTEDGRG